MAQLPKPQTDLPKPELDLPLPEKELTFHSSLASKGQALRSYGKKLPFPRYVFLGVVFVLLLIIVGGAYFLGRNSVFKELNPSNPVPPPADPVVYEPTPTPDLYTEASRSATADWQTYTNQEIGYSFKYPSFLKITDRGTLISADYKEFALDKDYSKYDSIPPFEVDYLSEKIADGPLGLDNAAFNSSNLWPIKNVGDKSERGEIRLPDMNISGNIARVYDANNLKEVLVKKNGNYYRIMMWQGILKAEKLNKNFELSNQILSTFKFTN